MLTHTRRWPGYRKCECGHGRRLHGRRRSKHCGRCRCRCFRWRWKTAFSAPLMSAEDINRLASYRDEEPG